MGRKIQAEKGIALITVILMLLVFTVLGVIAVNLTNVGTKITSNTKTSKQAFYLAEAGIERARELLRTRLVGGSTLSLELNSVKGTDGVLTDSSNGSNFSTSDDSPYVNTTALGNGSFKVYLTNDSVDGVTSLTDTNGIVTLTSFGYGPDNAQAVIQVTTAKNGGITNLPNLPGAISLAGPGTTFQKGSSNAAATVGGTSPAVAGNSASTTTSVINDIISSPDRSANFTGPGGSPSVQNLVFGSPWDSIPDLQKLYTQLKNNANFTSSSDSGFTYGTDVDQKIVVVDGNLTIGPVSGAGIILCTGTLTIDGAFNYNGAILAIGTGSIIRSGAGGGTVSGGIYAANIKGPDGLINTADDVFGNTSYDASGGGSSTISYNSNTYSPAVSGNVINSLPFARTSWKQF